MTEQAETARKIAIAAGALNPCPSCGVVHRTGVDPAEGYKVANLGFSQGLYRDAFPDRRAMTDAVKDAIESALTTCACSAPAPVKPPSPVATKPAAPTTAAHATPRPSEKQHPPGRTLRDIALASVSQELRESLLTWASENQITTPDDAFWPLATAMANAMRAASAAGQHAQAVEAATNKLPEILYKNVTSAGADLKAVLESGIKARADEAGRDLTNVILAASGHGADALKKASAGLDMMAENRAETFVEQWKTQVASAVERQARTALKRSIARSWVAASFALLLAASAGGAVALGGALLEHRLITVSDLRFYNPDPRRDAVLHYNGPGQITEARTCPQRDQACLNIP